MSESYTVIFSSRGANVLNNANLNSVMYNVNWSSFLPMQKRFDCQFVFKSETFAGNLTNNGFVSINGLGKTTIFDGQGNTPNVGFIYPVQLSAAPTSFYSSTNNDNNNFEILYPTSNTVTINLNTFAGNAMANMQHYCLILTMVVADNYE
jgi:hypothetical protein